MTKLFALAALCFFSYVATAQDTVYLKREAKHKTFTDREPQVVFFELGGPGVISFNYDRRFNKQSDGWGFRGGIGYLNSSDYNLVSVPVGVNFLGGRKGRYFEFGLNQSLIFVNNNQNNQSPFYTNTTRIYGVDVVDSKTIPLTSMTLGYRSQPVAGGFCFRVGAMPYTTFTQPLGLDIYISFGYNF